MVGGLQGVGAADSAGGGSVLVLGLGFIGTHVAAELAATSESPRVLTRSAPPPDLVADLGIDELIVGDASDRSTTRDALEGVRHVVFCAGGLLPAHSAQDPELDAVLTLPPLRTVLNELRRRREVGLTFISSGGTVYGEATTIPTPEDHPTRPTSAYGHIRVACEQAIERARREHGLAAARILRCATVYGEHQEPDRGQGAVPTFLRHVEDNEPIVLFGDPGNARDYVYGGDVARVVAALIGRTDGPRVLNVGSGVGTSLDELVALVETQVGHRADVARRQSRPFDVHRSVLNIARLQQLMEFRPTPLEEGVRRTHAWLFPQAAAVDRVA
jgi:UDP-glucose 4-epimerase